MPFTYAKLVLYLLEFHLMRLYAMVRGWPVTPLPKFTKEEKLTLNTAFMALLREWKVVLKKFPQSNKVASPLVHLNRYRLILGDLKNFLERKNKKESFDLRVTDPGAKFPEYIKRNFHYQTDGYFSEDSAKRYDHQIELLFLGGAHVMRKVAYSVLEGYLSDRAEVLEFGAGSGTSGFQFKLLYPHVSLDLLDPSADYLKYAQKTYPNSFNACVPEFMERSQLQKKYDCIFSSFVMHEIPVDQWDELTQKIKASLKNKGYLLIVDSQQDCDKPQHQFALDQFAEDYFEPYFPEFRKNSLEEYFETQGFKLLVKKEVLFSKSLLFTLV